MPVCSHTLQLHIAKLAVSDTTVSMIVGQINGTASSIPVYMPITVQVAIGTNDGSGNAFKNWMKSIATLVADMTSTYAFYEGSYCSPYFKSCAKNL